MQSNDFAAAFAPSPARDRRLKAALLGVSSFVALSAWSAGAHAGQAASATAVPVSSAAAASPDVEAIVVTGSRIVRDGFEAPTPTSVLGAQEIQAKAPGNIADFVNTLPVLAGSSTPQNQTSSIGAGSTGINGLNLRNLGAQRTLVLFDGRRLPASTITGVVDINTLPQALISRVEVVTGGASSAWGSDALTGVVNFILDREFVGFKVEAQGGLTSQGDNANGKLALAGGMRFADGRGHVLLSAEAAYSDGIDTLDRNWYKGAKLINNPGYTATNGQPRLFVREGVGYTTVAPGAIVTAGPLAGLYFGANGQPSQLNFGSPVSSPYMVGGDWQYTDFGRMASMVPTLDRQAFFSHLSFDLTNDIEAYAELSYARAHSSQYSGPQYQFGGIIIQRDNAFLPQSVVAQMTALGQTSLNVGSWNSDLFTAKKGESESNREQARFLVGLKGKSDVFGKTWNWDVYAQRGSNEIYNDIERPLTARYNQSIDAVRNASGAIVCRSTLTNPNNGCAPLNILGTGVSSEAAYNWFAGTSWLKNWIKQDVVAASFSGEPLENWAGPISLAGGFEYRKESVKSKTDPLSPANAYFSGNYKPTFGHYSVVDAFAETVVPLLKDAPMAQSLDLSAAVRQTHYSTSGNVTTWKVGLNYRPIDDITFRSVRSRDIRSPNLSDLYQAGATITIAVADPFRGNLSSNILQVTSGNTALTPEVADTFSIGAVVQPRFIPRFTASVDYYDIKIADAISSFGQATILDQCFAGNTIFCGQTVRNSAGVLTQINVQPVNVASVTARGVDFEAGYRLPLEEVAPMLGDGVVSFRVFATRYIDMITDNTVTVSTNSVGQNTGNLPTWRYNASVSYSNGPANLALSMRGFSDGVYSNSYVECTSGCPTSTANNMTIDDNHIDGAYYFDASFRYDITASVAAYVSVDNLLDRAPSRVATGTSVTGPQPGVNQSLYDTLGRSFRTGIRLKF
jgi:iron complex outermembrane receptor protein